MIINLKGMKEMQNWKRVLLLVAVVIALLASGGAALYKFIIVPKYIEPILVSVSTVMRDPDIQDTIVNVADDLSDKGVIDENVLKNYLRKAKRYTTAERVAMSGTRTTKSSSTDNSEKNTNNDEKITDAQYAKSVLGIDEMSLSSNNTENARVNESYSSKYSSYNNDDDDLLEIEYGPDSETDEIQQKYLDSSDKADTMGSEVSKAVSDTRAGILYNKIMSAMTASERAVFFSVVAKTDVNQLMQMYKTSNKSGAKQYLQSVLESNEYSEAVEIFFKYAPLLIEE